MAKTVEVDEALLADMRIKCLNWDRLMASLFVVYETVRDALPPDYDHGALLALVAHAPHAITPEEYAAATVADGTARDQRRAAQKADEASEAQERLNRLVAGRGKTSSNGPAPAQAALVAAAAPTPAAPEAAHAPAPEPPSAARPPAVPEPQAALAAAALFDDEDEAATRHAELKEQEAAFHEHARQIEETVSRARARFLFDDEEE